MKVITQIEQQKHHRNRYSIYIDKQYAFGVDEEIVLKYHLLEGKTLSDQFIEDVLKAEAQVNANNYAVNLLSFRARSKREVIRRMKEKGYEDELIENTLAMLEKYGYLNDYDFAKLLVRDKVNLKKLGKGGLKQELYQKGVDREIIDRVISEEINEEDEFQRGLELAKNKLKRSTKHEEKSAQYRKLYNFLSRRGYSGDITSRICRELLNDDSEAV